MQRIQTFRVFESRVTLTKGQEMLLNNSTRNGSSWSLNPAGEVDVEGDFDYPERGLEDFNGVKFGRVSGDFHCWENSLTSLVGSPQEVGGGFYCSNNSLPSLKGAPQKVEGNFHCGYNELTSLAGAPQKVGGDFRCGGNKLTSLAGAPREVKGEFSSDMVKIPKGQWGLKGWLDAYAKGNDQARSLLITLMSPDVINRMMQEAPEQTIIDLGPIWNDPAFDENRAKIRVPDRYRDEMGMLGDLGELGF